MFLLWECEESQELGFLLKILPVLFEQQVGNQLDEVSVGYRNDGPQKDCGEKAEDCSVESSRTSYARNKSCEAKGKERSDNDIPYPAYGIHLVPCGCIAEHIADPDANRGTCMAVDQ